MATNKELEDRLRQIEASLARANAMMEQAGLVQAQPSDDPQDRPDYWPFGPHSPKHAALLGIIELAEGEEPPMGQRFILEGKEGLYCLEDEIGAMGNYPGLSLDEVVPVVLRQKINVYEAGQPPVPANAPPMWTPDGPMTI